VGRGEVRGDFLHSDAKYAEELAIFTL